MKKAAIYLRVSSLSQDYERQRDEIEDYCKRYDYQITKVFEEKISGAKDERPQFNELCELTKDDIDAVVVWEVSRIGRKLTTVIKAVEDFKDKGINVISIKEHFTLFEKDGSVSPSSMIMMSLFSTMAVVERENIIERTMSGKIFKMKSGELDYTDNPPFGYRKENKRIVINEEEAALIRKIYEEYLSGLSMAEIAKINGTYLSRVARILRRPVYCGQPYSNLLNKTLTAPQIVSVDYYTKAREICAQRAVKRAKTSSFKYILKCKVRCEHCGGVLSYKEVHYGCRCGKSNVQTTTLTKASNMVLEQYKEDRAVSDDAKSMNEKRLALDKRHKTIRKMLAVTTHELEDARAKVTLLSDIFTIDKLKKEVAEVKRLENQMKGYDKELVHLKMEKHRLDEALNADITYATIDDITDNVVFHTIDKRTKTLTYRLIDGSEYIVTVTPRKHEYSIKKRDS